MAGNVVAGLASGHDFGTSVATGVGVPLLTDMGRLLLNRMLAQPPAPDPEPLHIQYLRPTINLETHQPNVGATQQPLPVAVAQQPMALPAPSTQPSTTTPTYSEWSQTAEEPQRRSTAKQSFEKAKTPQKKAKAKPAPAPNFQEGGASSSSSGNAPQPQAQTEAADRKGSRKTIKQNVKEAQEETANMTLLRPSK